MPSKSNAMIIMLEMLFQTSNLALKNQILKQILLKTIYDILYQFFHQGSFVLQFKYLWSFFFVSVCLIVLEVFGII